MQAQFAYLQIYSRLSPFGGVSEVPALAERLAELSGGEAGLPLSAALTDTFSTANYPLWRRMLAENGQTGLAGAEIGLNLGGERSLPFALLLLAESAAGYSNLCRLLSAGLARAGSAPMTAQVDLPTLERYRAGLIAVAPYWGGPVGAALLSNKASDARARIQILRDLFGPAHFYVAAQPPMEASEERAKARDWNKLNASLVKLCRELKVGLIGTGEARYARPDEARAYGAGRGRLQKALLTQYPPTAFQGAAAGQEWLYSPHPVRPLTDLHLRPPAELIAYYNEADWPGALANNALVAARCGAWQPDDGFGAALRERCVATLGEAAPDATRQRLESELADIAEFGLAEGLLAAAWLVERAGPTTLAVARRLSGSLVAGLLGLHEGRPETSGGGRAEGEDKDSFSFEAYTGGRPVRIEIGAGRREELAPALQDISPGAGEAGQVAAVAMPGESGELPMLHPRLVLVGLAGPLADLVVLGPAQAQAESESDTENNNGADPANQGRIGLAVGAQVGPVVPPGTARLELYESSGVGQLQLGLDILNEWRQAAGQPALPVRELAADEAGQGQGRTERETVLARLDWLKRHHPAAYYAALLSSAPTLARREALAGAVRLSGLTLQGPEVNLSGVESRLEISSSTAEAETEVIRAGLGLMLEPGPARRLVEARGVTAFADLDDFVRRVALGADEIERLAWAGALDSLGERASLAGSAAAIEAAGRAWQDWREQAPPPGAPLPGEAVEPAEKGVGSGQLSLFDLFASSADPLPPPPTREEPAPLTLTPAEPMTALEKLRRAYRVLGFFTAAHPLWLQPAQTNSDAGRDIPVGLDQVGTEETGRPGLVVGLVTGLRRLPIAPAGGQPGEAGAELTVVQLEDWGGRAWLLVPPGTPTDGIELAEGVALTARVRRLTPPTGAEAAGLTLTALAVAPYPAPPGSLAAPVLEDSSEAQLNAAITTADPWTAAPPTEDGGAGWSDSLFAGLGIDPAPPPKGTSSGSGGGGGGGRGGKAAAQARPVQRLRRVHIHLSATDSEEADLEQMNLLKAILRRHPGDDRLVLYLPGPDGSTERLEPQGLEVAYGPPLVEEITALLGPNSIKLEER